MKFVFLISDVDNAIETFKRIIEEDPYCLDNMDTYSNLLYVKEMKVELAYLAHRATEIDKYRLETCCIVGECRFSQAGVSVTAYMTSVL